MDIVAMARAAMRDERLSDGALYGKLADEIEILREALRPFAEIGEELQSGLRPDHKNTLHWAVPTVGQLRHARDVFYAAAHRLRFDRSLWAPDPTPVPPAPDAATEDFTCRRCRDTYHVPKGTAECPVCG
jgi:hypothetical protein